MERGRWDCVKVQVGRGEDDQGKVQMGRREEGGKVQASKQRIRGRSFTPRHSGSHQQNGAGGGVGGDNTVVGGGVGGDNTEVENNSP